MASCPDGAPLRVAWIGNSYVYFSELPSMVAGLLRAHGQNVTHGQVTVGGQTLTGHAQDERVAQLLREPWDIVVLQDNSSVPGLGTQDAEVAASEASLTDVIAPLVRAAGATPLLYATWGHRHGCVYQSKRAQFPDYATMQRETTAGYERFLHLLGADARLAPVGNAFERIHSEEIDAGRDPLGASSLFSRCFAPDNFHPSRLGTYLAACVFALVLAGVSPLGSPFRPKRCGFDDRILAKSPDWEGEWPAEVGDEDAARLQRAAHAAVGARRPEQTLVTPGAVAPSHL